MAIVPAKGAAQQLYRSLFAILTGDAELGTLLQASPTDPHVYQTSVDFDTAAAIKGRRWITFNITSDQNADVEQIVDVRDIRYDVHVWYRGPQADEIEEVESRVRELLDDVNISTASLFSWINYSTGYNKTYEAQPEVWHITISFVTKSMAIVEGA